MAHFAHVNSNNIVTQVLVVSDTDAVSGQAFLNSIGLSGTWLQTSYNTIGNKHYVQVPLINNGVITGYTLSADGLSGLCANYAGIGYVYDTVYDVFYAPQPYPSWILNVTSFTWEAPITKPSDGKRYTWNESTTSWVAISS